MLVALAALVPVLVGAIAGIRSYRRVQDGSKIEKGRAIDDGEWLGRYFLALIALAFVFALAFGASKSPRTEDSSAFVARMSDRLDFMLLISGLTAVVLALPVAAAFGPQEGLNRKFLEKPVKYLGTRSRQLKVFAALGITTGLASGLAWWAGENHFVEVTERAVRFSGLGEATVHEISPDQLARVIEFERRGGVVGRPRNRPHVVIVDAQGRTFDSFTLVGSKTEGLLNALKKLSPDLAIERADLHRVDMSGKTIEGL